MFRTGAALCRRALSSSASNRPANFTKSFFEVHQSRTFATGRTYEKLKSKYDYDNPNTNKEKKKHRRTGARFSIKEVVEEKFPKENFRVNRERRDEILVYDLFLTKFWEKMAPNCRENAAKIWILGFRF